LSAISGWHTCLTIASKENRRNPETAALGVSREEHMLTKVLSLFVFLVSTFAMSQTPDPTPVDGRVSGRVVNGDGKPVADATVYLVEQGPSLLIDTDRLHTTTNSRGYFDFGETLKHAIYEIYVQKDKDGYPDPFSPFYRPPDFTPETVQLFGEKPEVKISIKLGEKAAVLRGTITDGDTGLPLTALIGLRNLEGDGGSGETVEGKFRELVPANTEISVLVQGLGPPDYNPGHWSRFHTELTLQPGEEQTLDIRLFRSPTP
jgi:hypothetical protein